MGASVDTIDEDNVTLCEFFQPYDELVWMGTPRNHIKLTPQGVRYLSVRAPDNIPLSKCTILQTFITFPESKVFLKAIAVVSQIDLILPNQPAQPG